MLVVAVAAFAATGSIFIPAPGLAPSLLYTFRLVMCWQFGSRNLLMQWMLRTDFLAMECGGGQRLGSVGDANVGFG